MKQPVIINCPAKINLYLDVIGTRGDGYHDVSTVMAAIDLYDELHLEECPEGIRMVCTEAGLPTDSGNLCWRAADALRRAARIKKGVSMRLAKKIPVAAGLGGGSSDAAGVLRGLNELWGVGLSAHELDGIAAGLGADVAFFLRGGTALCRGRGELVTPLSGIPSYAYVLISPPISVSTQEVYGSLGMPERPAVSEGEFLRALVSGDPTALGGNIYNALENNGMRYMDEVRRLKSLLRERGVRGAAMSGSGSSVFGIAESPAEAKRAGENIRDSLIPGSLLHCGITLGTSQLQILHNIVTDNK